MTPEAPTFQQGKIFSRIELRDITVAWLALGLAFAIMIAVREGLYSGAVGPSGIAYLFLVSILTVGPGFVFHELSHKFVAQRYGFWAEFRTWSQMLVLALMMSFLGFVFAAPGATYISGLNISKSENGKISLAGPMTNVVIAILFIPFLAFGPGFLLDLGLYGVPINVFLAAFNMIPLGPLDGAKVFRWNIPVWMAVFVPLIVVLGYLYGLI
jgi:Zn-dependent protease